MKFEQLGLKPEILKAIASKGYKIATPIQTQAIPAIIEGKDLLGGAQTGTGKTAAFALPILEILSRIGKRPKHPRAVILTPTRELAAQVGESFIDYGKFLNLRTLKIYGGVKIKPQIINLRSGSDIIIATPGRLLDHLEQGTIKLSYIETLVLDEADRMLDMGFIKEIKRILKYLPQNRQNLLFSATYGNDIKALARNILHNPVYVEVARRNTAAENVKQLIHYVDKNQKCQLLVHLINEHSWYRVLVFVKTKLGAKRLAVQLQKAGIPTTAIHGDKSQYDRTRALAQFKKGDIQALIATDIASRGIHLEDLNHVVNFDLPNIPEDYIHRIGRTGRAGKSGTAISLISPDDKKQLQNIQKLLKISISIEPVSGFKPVNIPPTKETKPATNNQVNKSNTNKFKTNKSGKFKSKKKTTKSFVSKKTAPKKRRLKTT